MGITHGGWADCDNSGKEAQEWADQQAQTKLDKIKADAKSNIQNRERELKN